jgi:hypothetical protein
VGHGNAPCFAADATTSPNNDDLPAILTVLPSNPIVDLTDYPVNFIALFENDILIKHCQRQRAVTIDETIFATGCLTP